ncbi:S8 family serine peptidase [Isoptericola sp. NPDC019693]|uniref:S8 family serine peptidase n=1 Tax=Isoptericola sp. NPDC019693 TaxID=3364009 RepID=UPI003796345C
MSETPDQAAGAAVPDPNHDYRPVRFLDPSLVRRRPGVPAVRPTWYVADRVIVQGPPPRRFVDGPNGPVDVQGVTPLASDGEQAEDAEVTEIERLARDRGCTLALESAGRRRSRRPDGGPAADDCDDDFAFALRLVPDRDGDEPDAWEIVEALGGRLELGGGHGCRRVSLDHVMLARPFTSSPFTSSPFTSSPFTSSPFTSSPFTSSPFTSSPFTSSPFTSSPFTSSPFTSSPFASSPMRGMAEYAVPGWGGRAPVAWLGGRPARRYPDGPSPYVTEGGMVRPLVAIVDTGLGTHPWFGTYDIAERDDPAADVDGNGVVVRHAVLPDGRPIGTQPVPARRSEDAEIGGASAAALTGPLDPVAGHGTFIAGIVHQKCPDAAILPVRVVGGDGVGAESDLVMTLSRLLEFHQLGLAAGDAPGDAGAPVDVVVLSLGYYHEEAEELGVTDALRAVIDELRSSGVVVVTAAGNDGTTRPSFPAALAPLVERTRDPRDGRVRAKAIGPSPTDEAPPVLAVGAENPDGTTALFSNDGRWVTTTRCGAAVVSTIPTTLDGPITPSLRIENRFGAGHRATLDIEGFQGGFATWSGTSFAAPVLAGEIASTLVERRAERVRGVLSSGGGGSVSQVQGFRLDDAWTAVTEHTGLTPPGSAAME